MFRHAGFLRAWLRAEGITSMAEQNRGFASCKTKRRFTLRQSTPRRGRLHLREARLSGVHVASNQTIYREHAGRAVQR